MPNDLAGFKLFVPLHHGDGEPRHYLRRYSRDGGSSKGEWLTAPTVY